MHNFKPMNEMKTIEKVEYIATNGRTRIVVEGENAKEIASMMDRYLEADAEGEVGPDDLRKLRESFGLDRNQMNRYYGVTPQIYGYKERTEAEGRRSSVKGADKVIWRFLTLFGIPPKLKI